MNVFLLDDFGSFKQKRLHKASNLVVWNLSKQTVKNRIVYVFLIHLIASCLLWEVDTQKQEDFFCPWHFLIFDDLLFITKNIPFLIFLHVLDVQLSIRVGRVSLS